jgi:aminoglycoside phosphotransferase family enzyme
MNFGFKGLNAETHRRQIRNILELNKRIEDKMYNGIHNIRRVEKCKIGLLIKHTLKLKENREGL